MSLVSVASQVRPKGVLSPRQFLPGTCSSHLLVLWSCIHSVKPHGKPTVCQALCLALGIPVVLGKADAPLSSQSLISQCHLRAILPTGVPSLISAHSLLCTFAKHVPHVEFISLLFLV